jgi:hypothetical protein
MIRKVQLQEKHKFKTEDDIFKQYILIEKYKPSFPFSRTFLVKDKNDPTK